MPRDESKDVVLREQLAIEVECTLRDMGVGNGDAQASGTKGGAQQSDPHPMIEIRRA